jgi:hypothetical protein
LGHAANFKRVFARHVRQIALRARDMQRKLAEGIGLWVRLPGEFVLGDAIENALGGFRLLVELHQYGINDCHGCSFSRRFSLENTNMVIQDYASIKNIARLLITR